MFFFGEFVLKKNKKGYYTVKSIDMIDVFYDLRLDMDKLSCATYLCDFCRAVALEGHEQHELFILLIKSLSLLCHQNIDYRNVKLKFEISAMDILGYGIIFDRCSICGGEIGEFSSLINDAGGVVCRNCNSGRYGTPISLQGIATLRQLQEMPIDNIGVIKITDKVYETINDSFKRYIYWHIEHTFKSIKFLENH
jgi:DNA repair protein RecO (recombination protein O)